MSLLTRILARFRRSVATEPEAKQAPAPTGNADDALMQAVLSRCFESGNTVFVNVDDEGNVRWQETTPEGETVQICP